MANKVEVPLSDREAEVLAELAKELDLPEYQVMRQALRLYQSVQKRKCTITWAIDKLPMMKP